MSLISVIVPTYNEAARISHSLRNILAMAGHFEVIVVDGNSKDDTMAKVAAFPEIRCLQTRQAERALQMNHGAAHARGEALLFLHADTTPAWNSIQLIADQLKDPEIVGGSFRLQFDNQRWYYRLLAFFSGINSPLWTFGDQGIFVRTNVFHRIGGYARIPILEDLDLQRRLRREGDFVKLRARMCTSARRYDNNPLLKELGKDLAVLCGYFAGMDPHQLHRWYSYPERRRR